ncbi:ankyrin repeat domain-containing protein [Paludisphaera rhizosphaerae]|uniref:ankyrin repeat domain-containing protein n=1 Tax=Paludisphaera rhizosphaerae TaxID=2711216 RepID=UPI0013EB4C08|nr:ankyrin repeat domain-containing protein [Paludisphaera rhizosphaerae]
MSDDEPDEIPSHHNASRRAMAETFFRGRTTYEAYDGLEEARKHADAVAILDSSDDETLAVFPVRLIDADGPTMDRLIDALEDVLRGLRGEKPRGRRKSRGRVFFEPPALVSEYVRANPDGVSFDEELAGLGLETAVEAVFRGEATDLDPAAVDRISLMQEWWPALERRDVDAVGSLLDQGVPIDARDVEGATALLIAARKGYAGLSRLLLDRGADPNAADRATWTPMTAAASIEKPALIEAIEAAGGLKGLREAVLLGDVDLARKLLDETPTLDVSADARTSDGHSFLAVAADRGRLEMCRFLIDRGADLESTGGDFGWTALTLAAAAGHAAVVELLLDRGAQIKPDQGDGHSPLSLAAKNGREDVARLLLGRGAPRGLMEAVVLGDVAGVAAALAPGANPDPADLCDALDAAVDRGDAAIVRMILDHGPATLPADCGGRELLGHAAKAGRLDVVKLLVERGVDPRKPDLDGFTPLARAERAGHSDVVRFLRGLR